MAASFTGIPLSQVEITMGFFTDLDCPKTFITEKKGNENKPFAKNPLLFVMKLFFYFSDGSLVLSFYFFKSLGVLQEKLADIIFQT
jgi:hypothetical protein